MTTPSSDTPVALARLDLKRAQDRVSYKDTPDHRQQVENARLLLDDLLDARPSAPDGPGAKRPGPSVSLAQELLDMQEGTCKDEQDLGDDSSKGEL